MFKVLCLSLVLFIGGCGGDDSSSNETPQPPPQQSAADKEFASDIQPILTANCAGSGCHTSGKERDQVIVNAANFVGSEAKNRLAGASMPPSGSPQASTLLPAMRGKLITFINKHGS